MPKDVIVAKEGGSTVIFDNRELIRQADKITDGAVSSFLDAAHDEMDPVVSDAHDRMLWPVRTGESVDATHTEDRLTGTSVAVVALNKVPHTFKLRFSVRTAAGMDREARAFAVALWGRLAPYVDRVGHDGNKTIRDTPGFKPLAGQRGAKQRVAHHVIRELSDGEMKGWYLDGIPSEETIRASRKAQLFSVHGEGAPSERYAGKHVWSVRVRNPARKRIPALIENAREALDKLAEG